MFTNTCFLLLVCKLNPGVSSNSFLSSSWDSIARLWKIAVASDNSYHPVLLTTFKGHSAAVWSAIQLPSKQVITCSADKTILVHNTLPDDPKNSTVIKKLTGKFFF